MNPDYAEFLAGKAPRAHASGFEPGPLPHHLFDFQASCVDFAIRQGRTGLYLDTGLGKTRCQLEWARQCAEQANGRALILTPLAVAKQIEREGQFLFYDCRVIREQSEARDGISICNYDRLDKLDIDEFGAVSLDEASVLKSFTGKTTRALIDIFAHHRFRMAATATPAPNDHMELGQQAEFLGIMPSNEMLMRWFIADQTEMGRYRLKGHGEQDFWDWMASWSRLAQSPNDLGFDGSRFILPPLNIIRHRTIGSNVKPIDGSLFVTDVSATNIFDIKRQTSRVRAEKAASLIPRDDDYWLIWCDTNDEEDALSDCLPGAVTVRGSMSIEMKEERLLAFATGGRRILITKPSIGGQGLNLQHCANMIYVGRSFSYEAYYQSVRRCWRFGQKRPVNVHIIVAEGEDQIGRVIDRKGEDHADMKIAMAAAMRRAVDRNSADRIPYNPQFIGKVPPWLTSSV